jgi:hypothetical protein
MWSRVFVGAFWQMAVPYALMQLCIVANVCVCVRACVRVRSQVEQLVGFYKRCGLHV